MNAKIMSTQIVVVVLVTLSNGVPIQESKDFDHFLAQLKGKTCLSKNTDSPSNGSSYYDYCFDVCYNRNGVHVCYKKCGYSVDKPVVYDQNKGQDLQQFLSGVNGSTCIEDSKSIPTDNSYYDYCFDVCYDRNGVKVCYKKCGYSANVETIKTQSQDNNDLVKFFDQINGSTCISEKDKSSPNYYNLCFYTCFIRNGIRVCYNRCNYAANEETSKTQETNDLKLFLAQINGITCVAGNDKISPNGSSYYDYCVDVCYDRNGVKVCYKKCGYSSSGVKPEVIYSAKCQMICHMTPNGGQACSFVCI